MCETYPGFLPNQSVLQAISKPENPTIETKASSPDLQRSGVVYKIPCAVCSKVYIGQTGRRLCQRISEAVKSANFNYSTLAEHAWSAGHHNCYSTHNDPSE